MKKEEINLNNNKYLRIDKNNIILELKCQILKIYIFYIKIIYLYDYKKNIKFNLF